MDDQPLGIAGALARIRAAIVRAFTQTRHRGEPHADGTETTLFGHLPERSRTPGTQRASRDLDWDAGGESTDFADPDSDQKPRR